MTTFRWNVWAILLASAPIFAQAPDASAANSSEAAGQEREVSWKKIFPNFLDDQKHIWLFPSQVARGYHLVPTAAVLGVSAALTVADPIEGRYFRANSETYRSFDKVFTGTTTTAEIFAVPIAFYLVGRVRKDSYAEHTALLSAQAVADIEVPNVILRTSTRRLRPADVPINGNFSDTWFDAGTNPLKAKGSFVLGPTLALECGRSRHNLQELGSALPATLGNRYRSYRNQVMLAVRSKCFRFGIGRRESTTGMSKCPKECE